MQNFRRIFAYNLEKVQNNQVRAREAFLKRQEVANKQN
jgi:hypothetical protein